jgi:hypothetical protein
MRVAVRVKSPATRPPGTDRLVASAHLDLRGNWLSPREAAAGLREPGWPEAK